MAHGPYPASRRGHLPYRPHGEWPAVVGLGALAVLGLVRTLVPVTTPFSALATSVVVCIAALWLFRTWGPQEDAAVHGRAAIRSLVFGAAVAGGVVLLSCAVLNLASAHMIVPAPVDLRTVLVVVVAYALVPAMVEEVAFRGIALPLLARRCGALCALVVTSVAFGLLHAFNPSSTPWTSIALALGPGLLFGTMRVATGRTEAAIGAHIAWNAIQILVGSPLSGIVLPGPVRLLPVGPPLLTGGAFGLEASPVLVAIAVAASAVVLVASRSPTTNGKPWRSGETAGEHPRF